MIPLKTVVKKSLCLALVILLCLAPSLSVAGLAVDYPEGVSREDCVAAIPKLDQVIPAAMAWPLKPSRQSVHSVRAS